MPVTLAPSCLEEAFGERDAERHAVGGDAVIADGDVFGCGESGCTERQSGDDGRQNAAVHPSSWFPDRSAGVSSIQQRSSSPSMFLIVLWSKIRLRAVHANRRAGSRHAPNRSHLAE